jgi:hypothetical protein
MEPEYRDDSEGRSISIGFNPGDALVDLFFSDHLCLFQMGCWGDLRTTLSDTLYVTLLNRLNLQYDDTLQIFSW